MVDAAPYVLIAMTTTDRARGMQAVTAELGHESELFTDAEQLLYYTRGSVPEAVILEHRLAETVPQLDLVSLLRKRDGFAHVPIVYLGPDNPKVQADTIGAGADAYLILPTRPEVLRVYLERLLAQRHSYSALRRSVERSAEFEMALKESERMKDDLIHMLVHDLKSPIASVMGLLDHAGEILPSEDTEGIGELLSLARTEAQHLLSLAANILDVRRMKEGHMPFHPEVIPSLTELAREALGDVSAPHTDRNFGFLVRPEADRVVGDPKLLRRVLANLLANAVKHTRRGGFIDFRAWKEDDHFVLSVRDDGEGIPEADQKRIFNAFEQSRHTIHDRYDSGMGLTFCKLAVEKHGGRIWVESRVGRGSSFMFTVPEMVEEELGLAEVGVLAH